MNEQYQVCKSLLNVWQYSLIKCPECWLTKTRSFSYLYKPENAIFSIYRLRTPKIGFFEVSNQISQKALDHFCWNKIFLFLEMCFIKPTMAHRLRIVMNFWPLPDRCELQFKCCCIGRCVRNSVGVHCKADHCNGIILLSKHKKNPTIFISSL